MSNLEYTAAFLIYLILGFGLIGIARYKKIYELAPAPNINIPGKDILATGGGVILIFALFPLLHQIYPSDTLIKWNSVLYIWVNFIFIYSYVKFGRLNDSLFRIKSKVGLGLFTLLLSLPWGAIVALLSNYVITTFYPQSITTSQKPYSDLILFQLSVIFIVPIYEEIFFRGLIQNYLAKVLKYSFIWTILLTSLIFTFVHYRPSLGISNLSTLPRAYISSLFLCYLYYKTRSLTSCICFHMAQNFLS